MSKTNKKFTETSTTIAYKMLKGKIENKREG